MNALVEFGMVISNTKQMVRLYAPIEFISQKLYIINIPHKDKFKFFYGVDKIVDLTNRCYIKQNGVDVSHRPQISDNEYWSFKLIPLVTIDKFLNLIPKR